MIRNKLMKLVVTLTVTTVITGFAIGCNDEKDKKVTNNSNITTEDQNTENKSSEETEVKEDEKVENETTTEEKNEVTEVKSEEFAIYSKDVNTDEEIVLGKVSMDDNKTVEEKLQKLSEQLSKSAFSDLPIEFMEITELEGKKVAIFDLKEIGKNAEETDYSKYENTSWFNNYFQGSTGGSITKYTLSKTLLQSDYSGEWIDGIKFTYKGEPIGFEHVESLGNVIYR